MKKAILLPLALLLVGGLVYAADLSGKVEAKAVLPSIDGDFDAEYGIEANINASVDDYNTATIELRQGTIDYLEPDNEEYQEALDEYDRILDENPNANPIFPIPSDFSSSKSRSSIDFTTIFLESDLGGALGITEASGVGLKIKAGDFNPETSDKGRISDNYIGLSDAVNGDLGDNAGVATNVVISYTDLVQLTVGLDLGQDAAFDYFFDVTGSTELGPGTLGYTVYYAENDSAGFYADAKAMTDEELSSRTSFGVEVQYANIAVADNFTIGVGAELGLALTAPDADSLDADGKAIAEDSEAGMTIGANLVANFDSWLGLEVGFKTVDVDPLADDILDDGVVKMDDNGLDTRLGIGLGLSTPDGMMGIKLPFILDMSANMEDFDDDNPYNYDNTSFEPKIWLKAGATEFSIAYALDLVDDSVLDGVEDDVDTSKITLQASLGF